MSRLDELQTELAKVFGRLAKWQLRCKEHNAVTEAQLIKLAEQVLAEPCTGTVAEARTYRLGLEDVETIDLKDFLGQGAAPVPQQRMKRP